MTENLSQLKQLFPILAALTGIAVFACVHTLSDFLLVEIFRRRNRKGIETEDRLLSEKNEILQYEKIIRKENVNCTWMIKTAGFLCLTLLAAAAIFHRVLIEKNGPELFSALILILSASAVSSFLQDKRWKTNLADDLIRYSFLFEAAAPDPHTGIRMMLLDTDTDFPLKPLLLEIQKNSPGISGKELMKTAGKILKSDALINAFSDEPQSEEKGKSNYFNRTDLYSPVIVFSAFGLMIILCFLL